MNRYRYARCLRSLRYVLFFNLVAYAPYRFDEFRISWRLMHFFTQAADMHHDGIVAVKVFFLPYSLKQLLAGDNTSLILAQIPQNRKLNRGQIEHLSYRVHRWESLSMINPLKSITFTFSVTGCIFYTGAAGALTRATSSSGLNGLVI